MTTDLRPLGKEIEERLAVAAERRREHQDHVSQHMQELEERSSEFNNVAEILGTVIKPRMQKLTGYFENATFSASDYNGVHCTCEFASNERFPASTKLSLVVTHDKEIKTVIVGYSLEILPIFMDFERHDQIDFPLGDVDMMRASSWVDEKLVTFVETYLRLEKVDAYHRFNKVTDPVCHMQLRKADAGATTVHKGKTYYFCVEKCQQAFLTDPERYTPSRP